MKIYIFIYDLIVIAVLYIEYNLMFICIYNLLLVDAFNNNNNCIGSVQKHKMKQLFLWLIEIKLIK